MVNEAQSENSVKKQKIIFRSTIYTNHGDAKIGNFRIEIERERGCMLLIASPSTFNIKSIRMAGEKNSNEMKIHIQFKIDRRTTNRMIYERSGMSIVVIIIQKKLLAFVGVNYEC